MCSRNVETGGDAEFMAALRLSLIPGIGPLLQQRLREQFGSSADVLAASPDQLRRVDGVGPQLVRSIVNADMADAEEELQRCRSNGIDLVDRSSDAYPRLLREICDPPGILYVRGALIPADALSVAIVGTRHATQYGLRQAERLGSCLAQAGLTVVSGLARGIDAAAHRGALQAGGRTVAVSASGLLDIYPPEHQQLAGEIAEQGALVSENPTLWKPLRASFPRRNRLISGLALGVVVVEAADRSGALVTARHAMEQGRDVFAVPGSVDSRNSRGCHQLIRDGAKLVETSQDVLEELGPLFEVTTSVAGFPVHHPAELQLNRQEQAVLNEIHPEPTHIDQVATNSGLPIHRVLSTISVLEMRHLIRRTSGTTVARV